MSTVTSPSDSSIETPGYIGLEVPGEPGVFFCARHKSVKVRLRCGRCETPICPKCTVMTPVGARCKNCGTNRSSHIFQITPLHAIVALGVSLALGALGAFIASLGVIGLFAVLYAPAAGNMAGRAVVKATRGKRGTKLAIISIIGFALGAIGFTLLLSGSLLNPWLWAFVGLSAAGAWYWIK